MSGPESRAIIANKYFKAIKNNKPWDVEYLEPKFLQAFEPVIQNTAGRFKPVGTTESSDIVGTCRLKFWNAVKKYNPDREGAAAFETYAISAMIKGGIAVRSAGRLCTRSAALEKQIKGAAERCTRNLNREPTEKEVQEEAGLTEEAYSEALVESTYNYPASLAQPIGDSTVSIEDIVVTPDNCQSTTLSNFNCSLINFALFNLPCKYRCLAGLLISGYTLDEIAKIMHKNQATIGTLAKSMGMFLHNKLCQEGHQDLFAGWGDAPQTTPWMVRVGRKVSSLIPK